MPNPFRLTIKWYIDYTLFPERLVWIRGETPVEFDGIVSKWEITPKDGELSSEELAAFLERVIEENARRDTSNKVLDPMAGYTAEQLRALARQIRKAECKVEQLTKGEPPIAPWQHATSLDGNETPWGDRGGWTFKGDWKLKTGETETIRLWLTPIAVVEV